MALGDGYFIGEDLPGQPGGWFVHTDRVVAVIGVEGGDGEGLGDEGGVGKGEE